MTEATMTEATLLIGEDDSIARAPVSIPLNLQERSLHAC